MHSKNDPLTPEPGLPTLAPITLSIVIRALALGWSDFRHSVPFGIIVAGAYVGFGWLLIWVTMRTGTSFWLVLAAFGFPLLGPFAAVGFYEVSRRRDMGQPMSWRAVIDAILAQRRRQLPMLCAIMIFMFLFWFFLAHMIFALFLGLSTMTNITSSIAVFLTPNGLLMLIVGTLVGGVFALLLFATTVLALPMLLDREVDFVTAMATSLVYVANNPTIMLGWATFIALVTLIALLPAFIGLLIALPLLGHASWLLYSLLTEPVE